jgi:1-acyl-sn-glycerol-3-phosphate acyltransferase
VTIFLKSYLRSNRNFSLWLKLSNYGADRKFRQSAFTLQCSIKSKYLQQDTIQSVDSATSVAPILHPKFSLPFESKLVQLFASTRNVLYQSWFRLECDGLENLPQDFPFLIAANHASHLDVGAVMTALRSQVHRVSVLGAKDYFCDTPMREWFFRTFFNLIPCDRHSSLLTVLRDCQTVLAPSEPILIFPEGTRSLTGKLQPFQAGVGFLALKLKVPILPVLIEGTFDALPKGKLLPRRQTIRVAFGSVLNPLEDQPQLEIQSNREICQAIAAELELRIQRLRNR